MTNGHDSKRILIELGEFHPETDGLSRFLAVYSAAIAAADEQVIKASIRKVIEGGGSLEAVYEMTLQSYLFLGFPRMLTAAECFQELFPDYSKEHFESSSNKFENWLERGTQLCRKVYAANFDKLKNRILSFSPEIFEWMILEGYGKVLTRPGLGIRDRELGIVACLMIESRPKQLFSHMRGALNVGVSKELVYSVIKDVQKVYGTDSEPAMGFLKRINKDV